MNLSTYSWWDLSFGAGWFCFVGSRARGGPYCFSSPASLAVLALSSMAASFLAKASNPEDPNFQSVWNEFFCNTALVKALGSVDVGVATQLVNAGALWTGEKWSTGRASTALYRATNIPLVSRNFEDYKAVFLYSLAMHFIVDVSAMDLPAEGAAAAFQLAEGYVKENMVVDGEKQEKEEHQVFSMKKKPAKEGGQEDIGQLFGWE